MSEIPTPGEENIEASHEEAVTINREVDELRRSQLPEYMTQSNSELAELAILKRAELARNRFNFDQEIQQQFMISYLRKVPESGLAVYSDPTISADLSSESLKPFLEYLRGKAYLTDISTIRQACPDYYEKSESTELPAVFIHSPETAEKYFEGDLGWRFEESWNRGNIHIIANNLMGLRQVFVHEFSHNLEPQPKNPAQEAFSDGVARLIEHKIIGTDPHESLALQALKLSKKPSDHPFFGHVSSDGLHMSVQDLSPRNKPHLVEKKQHWDNAESVRNYDLTASFLAWYSEHVDPDLNFLNTSARDSGFNAVNVIMHRAFRSGWAEPPQELEILRSFLLPMSMRENDPCLAEAKNIANRNDAKMEEDWLRTVAGECMKKLRTIEDEYNNFINDKFTNIIETSEAQSIL